jgi:cation:H+ antiporter
MLFFIILFLLLGGLALYKGADLLIGVSSSIAAKMGVSTVVVGLSVVAIGGIMPELSIGINASLAGANDLIIGNALGSSVLKLGLVFGIAALISPMTVQSSTLKHEFPWLGLAAVLIYLLAFDLSISRGDALILILLGIAFQWYSIRVSQREVLHEIGKQKQQERKEEVLRTRRSWFKIVLALALIILGAKLFVESSLYIAGAFGISELLAGIIIIALGTSIPELAVTVLASARHTPSIGIGNIIGSNVMNIHAVVGIAALIRPISIHPDLLIFDFPVFIFFTILISVLFASSHRLTRLEGGLLVVGYLGYVVYSIKFWA